MEIQKNLNNYSLEDVLLTLTLNRGSRFKTIVLKDKIQILREDQKHFITWQLNKSFNKQSQKCKDAIKILMLKTLNKKE